MRTAILGAALFVVGAIAIATGILPVESALALGVRVWPILLFVLAITVVTELAAEAGLFDLVAQGAARLGLRRTWLLWLFVVVIAAVSTVFLSLDTTAVLLTPVVVVLARHIGVSPLPFALTTVWLANTGSLLLPVSNLTNLLATSRSGGMAPVEFAALMALPATVAIVIPVVILFLVFRRSLVTRYIGDDPVEVPDRLLLTASAIVVLALLPLLVSGLPVWMPALAAALVLVVLFAIRRPHALRFGMLPWQVVVFAAGLFVVVEAAHSLGLGALLQTVSGTGHDLPSLLRLAGTGAVGANAVDNLPAYLALEPVAGDRIRLAALLIGVNAGPLITPWASLATLLWHERLVALDVRFPWKRYMLLGLVVAPLTVAGATAALYL
ncbi:MAG: SLC13 family permease [Actinomycetota bacterium]